MDRSTRYDGPAPGPEEMSPPTLSEPGQRQPGVVYTRGGDHQRGVQPAGRRRECDREDPRGY